MDDEEGNEFCQFVGTARTSLAAFRQRRGNNNNNNNRNTRTPAGPTTRTPATTNAGTENQGQ